jgi:two-component system, OmpR family, response regulator PhoP
VRLLIVEDDAALGEMLRSRLQAKGFAVDWVAEGREGLFCAREYAHDLAVIDLGLPGLSGIEVIRQLRAAGSRLPVLILTARDRWQDKVEGLDAGGDDYLAKPFQFEELLARINALIRRSGGHASTLLQCGPIQLDTATQQVLVEGQAVGLTAYEYRLLEYLMLNAGRVVSKTELTEHLYAQDFDRDSNVLEVFVGRLRRKLDPDGRRQPIETLRGRGYRLTFPSGSGG